MFSPEKTPGPENPDAPAAPEGERLAALAAEAADTKNKLLRTLAEMENRSRSGAAARDGDAEGEIDLVLWEMAHAAHLARSSRLAEMVQNELNEIAGTRDRGVKQAPFRVLVGARMPAVLVEVGFLTNSEEENLLASQDYRHRIAESVAQAVRRFESESMREARGGAASLGGGQ